MGNEGSKLTIWSAGVTKVPNGDGPPPRPPGAALPPAVAAALPPQSPEGISGLICVLVRLSGALLSAAAAAEASEGFNGRVPRLAGALLSPSTALWGLGVWRLRWEVAGQSWLCLSSCPEDNTCAHARAPVITASWSQPAEPGHAQSNTPAHIDVLRQDRMLAVVPAVAVVAAPSRPPSGAETGTPASCISALKVCATFQSSLRPTR